MFSRDFFIARLSFETSIFKSWGIIREKLDQLQPPLMEIGTENPQ